MNKLKHSIGTMTFFHGDTEGRSEFRVGIALKVQLELDTEDTELIKKREVELESLIERYRSNYDIDGLTNISKYGNQYIVRLGIKSLRELNRLLLFENVELSQEELVVTVLDCRSISIGKDVMELHSDNVLVADKYSTLVMPKTLEDNEGLKENIVAEIRKIGKADISEYSDEFIY